MTKKELEALDLKDGDIVRFIYEWHGIKKLGTGDFMLIKKGWFRTVVRVVCHETTTYYRGYRSTNENVIYDIKLKDVLGKV